MCHLATNAFKAVNVAGHIGAVDMAELLDELAERTLTLFRESLIAVKKEAITRKGCVESPGIVHPHNDQ